MMKTELLFPTPVWVEDDCKLDVKKLEEFCYYAREQDDIGRKASNDGGWQSGDFKLIQSGGYPPIGETELKPLHDKIMDVAYQSADDWGFQSYRLSMSNMWININKKGSFNHLHTHCGCIMSGVYYVKVPPCCCGELSFQRDPIQQNLKEYWGCDENFDRYEKEQNYMDATFPPADNKLILFPAWLLHMVGRSASDEDRISISFNIHVFSDLYINDEVYPKRKSNKSRLSLSPM